jgi:pimeloyl-ACP methyl ester carboxylesterase
MNHFTEALGLSRYTPYMQDYGGPVGFRMALAHSDRIEALIWHQWGQAQLESPARPFT